MELEKDVSFKKLITNFIIIIEYRSIAGCEMAGMKCHATIGNT